MSQDLVTQDTKKRTSKASKKTKAAEETSSSLPDLDKIPDVVAAAPTKEDVAPILKQEDVRAFEAKQMGMAEFEAQVQLALKTGHTWLEVPKETLIMICAGEYPKEHYICYKGLKVASEGMAQGCIEKEKITAHEKVFPNDKFKAVTK